MDEREIGGGLGENDRTLINSPTRRELDVLRLVAEGYGNRAIGSRLGIGERCVRFHLENLFGKLYVHSRTQLVYRARRTGWLK